MAQDLMDKITSLCKRRGFIFQSSEIYGGLGSVWDYGPLGVELKRNVKEAWWKSVVSQRYDMVGLDAAILMHPKVWEASGHISNFADLVVECKECHKRMRPEEIIKKEDLEAARNEFKKEKNDSADIYEKLVLDRPIIKGQAKCLFCGGTEFTSPKQFNLMFETHQGPVKSEENLIYLRPETAQGIFVNFLNVLDVSRKKLPFGVAQIGKSFRNEITPGNFTFRTREFEQMEIEYFVKPSEADKYYQSWVEERFNWYLNLGIKKDSLRKREHAKDELAHYAKACSDIEYNFPFGWSELEGIANRTDFDLRQHSEFSGKELKYFDPSASLRVNGERSRTIDDQSNEKYFPYIIEPSGGVDRATLAFLVDSYHEEQVHPVRNTNISKKDNISNGVKGETRVSLKLHKDLAPTKIAVFPLLKNRPPLVELAKNIASNLKKKFICVYDDTAAIGKLYRRQDEVGTLFCVTVDVQSLEDKKVTVRDRDTMLQERIDIEQLEEYIQEKLK